MDASASVIVVGYAKVPATSAVHATNEYFTVTLRIDRRSGLVIEVDCTSMTSLVQRWLSELLTGTDFTADIAPILSEIENSYLGQGAGSIRQAISDAWRRYASHRKA